MFHKSLRQQKRLRQDVWVAQTLVCPVVRGHVAETVKQDVNMSAKVDVKRVATQDAKMIVRGVANTHVNRPAKELVKTLAVMAAHVLVIKLLSLSFHVEE